jgi:DNA mismatch repair protein MLH1
LTSIGTYGFRGEALASISHIARLRVTTRTRESSCAYQAHYQEGKLHAPKPGQSDKPKPCAGNPGTQITVEDLFYNVPTRRRAFRSPSEEYAKILDMMGRYAIHCSGVAFSCKKHGDNNLGLNVTAAATTVDRIRSIHGGSVASDLIELKATNERWGFQCSGWVTNANYHGKRLGLLLFINHRAVESSVIKKAVESTYSTFLPKGSHPFLYMSLEIDPARVDVNVHPTKREVNFLNEDEIVDDICQEIRVRLGNVDTSRTFIVQSLLPGVSVPTISAASVNASPRAQSPTKTLTPGAASSTQRPSSSGRNAVPKVYENNLVRTDAKSRKITSMLPPSSKPLKSPVKTQTTGDVDMEDADDPALVAEPDPDADYMITDRENTICRLSTIRALRAAVRENMHNGLSDIITSHIFVGIVDTRRRIAAIQSGVKLLLVDYGMLCNEYFYQVGLTDFGNFGSIRLDPALSLKELLHIAAAREAEITQEVLDWEDIVRAVYEQLISVREMLSEYFSLEISAEGELLSLPLLMKGYTPSLAKLPKFLLRLGPHVDWEDEQGCFHSFLREMSSWYVPEPIIPLPTNEEGVDDVTRAKYEKQIRQIEHLFFPAFKARLLATRGMLKGVVEVADLKGLYRVFERC